MKTPAVIKAQHLERFTRNVDTSPHPKGCHVWKGTRNEDGYAIFSVGGKKCRGARWLWEQLVGPIFPGMIVMHTCDNPACVNLDHLKIGTKRQNTQDMVKKGRAANGARRHLTRAQINDIVHSPGTAMEKAERHGIHPYSVRRVARRERLKAAALKKAA